MAKYFENTCGNDINMELFGIGKISIPATAKSIELTQDVADAINGMCFPNVVLVEVKETADNPIIMSIEDDPDGGSTVEILAVAQDVNYEEMTNKDLKALLDAKGVKYHNNANKAELIDLLGVGEDVE